MQHSTVKTTVAYKEATSKQISLVISVDSPLHCSDRYHTYNVHVDVEWNLSNGNTLKWGHLHKQDTFCFLNSLTLQPLKSGHIINEDTFLSSSTVHVHGTVCIHVLYMYVLTHVSWPGHWGLPEAPCMAWAHHPQTQYSSTCLSWHPVHTHNISVTKYCGYSHMYFVLRPM